tara:strand:+ start:472 stop:1104 length:633 start_codon:yes stop_codon:yes gene_type:complete
MILAHRGTWEETNEQNTLNSFQISLKLGVGIETDLRDFNGEVIISHDIPIKKTVCLDDFFELWKKNTLNSYLALNIKSDGLGELLLKYINKYKINNYFLFDMSIPETKKYRDLGLKYFIRISEFEQDTAFLEESSGVWLDCFDTDWYEKNLIERFLDEGKIISLVSPELHQRPYICQWKKIKEMNLPWKDGKVLLCTDHPYEAKEFFNEI